MDNFQQEIYKTIEIITEKKLQELGYDRTKKGFVVSVDNEKLTSEIRIDGEVFTCRTSLGVRINIGDIVFVKFPEGNDNQKYVDGILSTEEAGEYLAMTPLQVLRALKTVDGAGSGLDADLLDGLHADELIDGERIIGNINKTSSDFYIQSKKIIMDGVQKDLEAAFTEVKRDVNYDVEIISTNGNIFKNGIIDTVLIATIRKGAKDITDTIDANKFLWTRVSEDKEADIAWNVAHFGGTKQVKITSKDVQKRATFICDLLE